MVGEVPEPQNPRLLADLSPGRVPMLVERLEILEDMGEALPPNAGCLIRTRLPPYGRVMILGHQGNDLAH
jgi:hypothetical protein